MFKALKLAALPLALTLATAAYAQQWDYVTASGEGMIVYVDSKSIETAHTPSGDYKLALIRWDHSEQRSTGYDESRMVRAFKCNTGESALKWLTRYRKDGTLIGSRVEDHLDFEPAAPETVTGQTATFVCGR